MRSLIVFAGAGASYGIAANKYPTTIEFKRRLPEEIQSDPLYQATLSHLVSSGINSDSIDIELVLWKLDSLLQALDPWLKVEELGGHLLRHNGIRPIVGPDIQGQVVQSQFSNLSKVADALRARINQRVYDYYSQTPTDEELDRSWVPLLRWLRNQHFDRIDVVTTNYDLVIESAIEKVGSFPIELGHRQGVLPTIDISAWRRSGSSGGMLTKLHGSVDWRRGTGNTDKDPIVRRGLPEFDGDHNQRVIIYPGYKGVPSHEPFQTFHRYFSQRVSEATHLLFIGFAFRDKYINDLLRSSALPSRKLAIVDPTRELPDIPFLEGALHLQQGFGIARSDTLLALGGIEAFIPQALDSWSAASTE